MWSEQHAVALGAVFSALNDNGVEWMVLRNYEGLPAENRAKDIDLVCNRRDFRQVHDIIVTVLKPLGFLYQEHTRFQCIWCFTFYNTSNARPFSLKIDLLDGFVWRGAQIVSFEELFSYREPYGNFYVPGQVYDSFMLWCKPLMTGGIIKAKYRQDILQGVEKYPEAFFSLLKNSFGGYLSEKVWPLLAGRDLDATIPLQKKLCHVAWRVALIKSPVKTLLATCEHFYREAVRRSRKPAGHMVAVIGPDGAGKSTFIELLHTALCHCLVKDEKSVVVEHFRPNIFPNIKKLLKGKGYDETKESFTSPHRADPAGVISSLLRMTYYWMDYLLGFWLLVRQRCIAGDVYLFDRYFYDFIADPFRSRVRLPDWLRMLFLKFTPEPDIVFFLDCEASIIYGRKQELDLPEIERQLSVYRDLAGKRKRIVRLDARMTPAELCYDAIRHLIERSFSSLQVKP